MPFSLDANTTKYDNLQVNTIWQAFAWFWKVHSGLFSCTRLSMHHPVKCSYLTHFDWIFTEIIRKYHFDLVIFQATWFFHIFKNASALYIYFNLFPVYHGYVWDSKMWILFYFAHSPWCIHHSTMLKKACICSGTTTLQHYNFHNRYWSDD